MTFVIFRHILSSDRMSMDLHISFSTCWSLHTGSKLGLQFSKKIKPVTKIHTLLTGSKWISLVPAVSPILCLRAVSSLRTPGQLPPATRGAIHVARPAGPLGRTKNCSQKDAEGMRDVKIARSRHATTETINKLQYSTSTGTVHQHTKSRTLPIIQS